MDSDWCLRCNKHSPNAVFCSSNCKLATAALSLDGMLPPSYDIRRWAAQIPPGPPPTLRPSVYPTRVRPPSLCMTTCGISTASTSSSPVSTPIDIPHPAVSLSDLSESVSTLPTPVTDTPWWVTESDKRMGLHLEDPPSLSRSSSSSGVFIHRDRDYFSVEDPYYRHYQHNHQQTRFLHKAMQQKTENSHHSRSPIHVPPRSTDDHPAFRERGRRCLRKGATAH